MTHDSLNPDERETIINGSDADDHVTIWSAQRRVITRLRKLACAELVEEGHYGTTVWAKFKLPAESIRFHNPMPASERERRRQAAIARGASVQRPFPRA